MLKELSENLNKNININKLFNITIIVNQKVRIIGIYKYTIIKNDNKILYDMA